MPITIAGTPWRSTSREATIPTTPGCQPSPASTRAGPPALARGQLAASALGGLEDLALGVAALAVGGVELAGDRGRPLLVLGQHQLDPGVGAVEPPGGVDPRPQPEREVALVEPLGLDAAPRPPAPAARAEAPRRAASRPARTSARFSPRSGTRSATVASATRSRSRAADVLVP